MKRWCDILFKTFVFGALLLAFSATAKVFAQDTNKFPGTGNAGVNTTSPPNPFTIVRGGDSPYTSRPAYELLQLVDKTDNTPQVLFGSNYNGMLLRYTSTSSTSASQRLGIFTGGGTEAFVVSNDGKVGIGTTSPGALLDVGGNSQYSPAISARKNGNSLEFGHTNSGGYGSTLGGTINSGFSFVAFNAGNDAGDTYQTFGAIGRVIWNDQSVSKWHFGHLSNGTAGSQTPTSDLTIDSAGKVGIGTTSPGARFHINSSTSNNSFTGTSFGALRIQEGTNNAGIEEFSALSFDNGAGVPISKIGTKFTNSGSYLYLGTSNNYGAGITNSALVIDYSGKVGIDNPSPQYKLDVNGTAHVTGNMTVDGNISAKYQDVAEWVPSSEQFSAGTVVVLDSTKSNHVTSSTVSYDTRVAGVVSEQPGIALGEKSDGKVLVATTGRVRMKVDATTSPIHIGDLLVTSDVPGVAMKSEPVNFGGVQLHRPGTLIGKALEPLEKGKGEVLVLLSLQ